MITSMLLNLTSWLMKSISTFWIIEFSLHLNQPKIFFPHFDLMKILSKKFKKAFQTNFSIFRKKKFENILDFIKIVIKKKTNSKNFIVIFDCHWNWKRKNLKLIFFRIFFFVVFFHFCSFLFISRSAVFYCSIQNWLKNQINCFF